VAGGGHTWPGGTPIPPAGVTSTDIDASAAMWDFFARFTR
jgi:poly(3-hydroxybutyrate) depolymerase